MQFSNMVELTGERFAGVGHGLYAAVVNITASMAKEMLASNKNNRKIQKSKRHIQNSMILGRWMLTGQPIIFSAGRLIDGQNRLHAIVDSGVSSLILVVVGVDDSAQEAIDSETSPRKAHDIFNMYKRSGRGHATKQTEAIARMLLRSAFSSGKITLSNSSDLQKSDIVRCMDIYSEEICVVSKMQSRAGPGVVRAAIWVVLLRAVLCGVDAGVLERFSHVLKTGLPLGEHEHAAVTLRNAAKAHLGLSSKTSSGLSDDAMYKKTQSALAAFIERRPLKKSVESKSEMFPLPLDVLNSLYPDGKRLTGTR